MIKLKKKTIYGNISVSFIYLGENHDYSFRFKLQFWHTDVV